MRRSAGPQGAEFGPKSSLPHWRSRSRGFRSARTRWMAPRRAIYRSLLHEGLAAMPPTATHPAQREVHHDWPNRDGQATRGSSLARQKLLTRSRSIGSVPVPDPTYRVSTILPPVSVAGCNNDCRQSHGTTGWEPCRRFARRGAAREAGPP